MSTALATYLEVIWSEEDVPTVIEAHEKFISVATNEDVPRLATALKSDRNNFWTRELISEPLAILGGADYLPELFDALEKNDAEGHDSDSLTHFLTEIASMNPDACREKLKDLKGSVYAKHVEWLLDFCK